MNHEILLEIGDVTATITLNRPDKRNAMTIAMWNSVRDHARALVGDRSVRAVVLTGAGASFCSGADVSALRVDDAELKQAVAEAERAVRELPMPTIAAIRGHCWGGGMQLAIAADLRVAARDASFAVPPARLGVVYPVSSLRAMLALVGPAVTKRMLFTGDPIDAEQAYRVGLIDVEVNPVELDGALAELIAQFSARSLLSQAAAKAVLTDLIDGGDGQYAYSRHQAHWATSDGAEGPAAFLGKRPPRFDWHPSDLLAPK